MNLIASFFLKYERKKFPCILFKLMIFASRSVTAGNTSVKPSGMEQNSVYMAQFEECLNLRYAIPSDLPFKFNVTRVNNHLNILVYDDGNYDYYEHGVTGGGCYTSVRKATNPTRTLEEQLECDAWSSESQYRCGYEVIKNKTDIVILVYSTDGPYEYNVDRDSGKSELYLYDNNHFHRTIDEGKTKCHNQKYATDFNIPLEVTMKSKKGEKIFEILIKYQGKYDLSVTEKTGYVRYTQMQLTNRPNNDSDYWDNIQCRREFVDEENFHCPLKVVENENYVNVSVKVGHYEKVYTIYKSNNAMKHFKVKDNFLLLKPDAELDYYAAVGECRDNILNATSASPFPVDVVRYKDFLQISVGFNGTLHAYKTLSNGFGYCYSTEQPLDKPSNTEQQSLDDVHPDCVRCEDTDFEFHCSDFNLEEDENEIIMKNWHVMRNGCWEVTTYKYLKSSGDVELFITGACGAHNIPTLVKSLVG